MSPLGGGTPIQFPKDTITVTQNPLDCSAALTDAGFVNPTPHAYNPIGSSVTITSGYTAIFNHASVIDCPLTTCVLKEPGCATALAPQTNVVLGSDPFGLTALETNVGGYSLTFCYECSTAGQTITKEITVIQNPVDCSGALVDASYPNPAPIAYNSAGFSITVATGFTDIFTHTQTTDCPVTACIIKDAGCGSTTVVGAQTDVAVDGSSPFALTGLETNVSGYSLTFCYVCTVSPLGGGTPIEFPKDTITVTQNPLDCSAALTDAGFANPVPFSYNSAESSVAVASGFNDIFTHSQTTDCPVTQCIIKDAGCGLTTVVGAQTDVSVGGSTPFAIQAIETNVSGYSLTFCYEC